MAGHGVTLTDYEGKEYEVEAGTAIYAPAGIAGAHEWEVKEGLTILAVRGTTESDRKLQFTVDKETKRSYIDLDDLVKREGRSLNATLAGTAKLLLAFGVLFAAGLVAP